MKTLLGYAYKDNGMYSKPNMTGYYMGDKQSTLGMQTGGQARIARAQQIQDDEQAFGKAERQEGKRQRKKSGWGKSLGLLGGLAGAALSPFTGGLSLGLASGAGSWLGSTLGGRAGGKARSADALREGTVFGQDKFRNLAKAGSAFDKQQKDQALMSAVTTGLTAGFSPGSMYGKVREASTGRGVAGWGNKLLTDYYKANTPNMASLGLSSLPSLGTPQLNAPQLFSSGFGTGTQTTPFNPTGSFALSPNPWSGVGSVTQPVKPNYLSLLGGR
jgi:hypothetical protein